MGHFLRLSECISMGQCVIWINTFDPVSVVTYTGTVHYTIHMFTQPSTELRISTYNPDIITQIPWHHYSMISALSTTNYVSIFQRSPT